MALKREILPHAKSFLAAFLSTAAAVIWLYLYPLSLWQSIVVALCGVVAVFLPWERVRTVRLLLEVLSAAVLIGFGIKLWDRLESDIPEWSVWLGWGVLLLLLCYMGKGALYECSVLPALLLMGALLLSFVGALEHFDGVIEWSGPAWQWTCGGAVVLVGCATSGLKVPHKNAAKAGALFGITLWGLTALVPLMMWSGQALSVLPLALPKSLARIEFLSFLGGTDIMMSTAVSVAALWQSARSIMTIGR